VLGSEIIFVIGSNRANIMRSEIVYFTYFFKEPDCVNISKIPAETAVIAMV
jgi:hypothetical protein